jgi:hypothetical protein
MEKRIRRTEIPAGIATDRIPGQAQGGTRKEPPNPAESMPWGRIEKPVGNRIGNDGSD